MKYIVYMILLSQSFVIAYLTSLMQERPFSNGNMQQAYYAGCNIGQHYFYSKKFTCQVSSSYYKEYMDRFDEESK